MSQMGFHSKRHLALLILLAAAVLKTNPLLAAEKTTEPGTDNGSKNSSPTPGSGLHVDSRSDRFGQLAAISLRSGFLEQVQPVHNAPDEPSGASLVSTRSLATIEVLQHDIPIDWNDRFTFGIATNETIQLELVLGAQIKTRKAELSIALPGAPIMLDEAGLFASPVLGLYTHYPLMDGFGLYARGDFGTFGFTPEAIWQAEGGFDFAMTSRSYLRLGYRFFGINATDTGFEIDEAGGPQIQFGFRF